jgi:hypothetical protein
MDEATSARVLKNLQEAAGLLDEVVAIAMAAAAPGEIETVKRRVGESMGAIYPLLAAIWGEHPHLAPEWARAVDGPGGSGCAIRDPGEPER